MKLVMYEPSSRSSARPGLLVGDGVVDASSVDAALSTLPAHEAMPHIIDHFDALHSQLDALAHSGSPQPLSSVRLRPPLPRPRKILCCIGNYWEHMQRDARPLNMFLKNPDGVIGPGDTIVLPKFTEPYVFQYEVEMAIVIKGLAKEVF